MLRYIETEKHIPGVYHAMASHAASYAHNTQRLNIKIIIIFSMTKGKWQTTLNSFCKKQSSREQSRRKDSSVYVWKAVRGADKIQSNIRYKQGLSDHNQTNKVSTTYQ